jgi:hypothetical protein
MDWTTYQLNAITKLAVDRIYDIDRNIRSGSLRLIAEILKNPNVIFSSSYIPLISILLCMAEDRDPRVRVMSFSSMRTIFEDIPFLSELKTSYHLGMNGLLDDDASVRLECILLLT